MQHVQVLHVAIAIARGKINDELMGWLVSTTRRSSECLWWWSSQISCITHLGDKLKCGALLIPVSSADQLPSILLDSIYLNPRSIGTTVLFCVRGTQNPSRIRWPCYRPIPAWWSSGSEIENINYVPEATCQHATHGVPSTVSIS